MSKSKIAIEDAKLFTDNFGQWFIKHGGTPKGPWALYAVNLNKLKAAIMQLDLGVIEDV